MFDEDGSWYESCYNGSSWVRSGRINSWRVSNRRIIIKMKCLS